MSHGTMAGYDRGCRCDECRKANAAKHREARARRLAKGAPEGIEHGAVSTATNWGCKCDPCREALRERNRSAGDPDHFKKAYVRRHPERVAAVHREFVRREQAESAAVADRRGFEWTGPELELAARDDLTARQVAAMTGRTVYAVRAMRKKLATNPREQRMASKGSGYQ